MLVEVASVYLKSVRHTLPATPLTCGIRNSDQATLFLFSINVTHHRIKMLLVGPLEVDRLLHAEPLLIYTRVAKVLVDGLVARPGSLEVAMHAIGGSHAADRANQLAAVAYAEGQLDCI